MGIRETEEPTSTITITLSQEIRHATIHPIRRPEFIISPEPTTDPARDIALRERIIREAEVLGISINEETKTRPQLLGLPDNRKYYGGPPIVHDFAQIITFAAPYVVGASLTAGGIAAFVRNALGSIAEWRTLRQRRSVTITVKGQKIEVLDGVTAEEVIDTIQDALHMTKGRRPAEP